MQLRVKHAKFGLGSVYGSREVQTKDGDMSAKLYVLFDQDSYEEENADWYPAEDLTVSPPR